jgi:hypothetical protein
MFSSIRNSSSDFEQNIISPSSFNNMPSINRHMFSRSSSRDDYRSELIFGDTSIDLRENKFYTNHSSPRHSHMFSMIPDDGMHGDRSALISSYDREVHSWKRFDDHQDHQYTASEDCPPIPSRIFVPDMFPLQKRLTVKIPAPMHEHHYCETVGNPTLNIHRFRLPSQFLSTLDYVVNGCESHAQSLPNGWHTDLYSLTKQDIALRDIPHLYEAVLPIVSYIKKATTMVSGTSSLRMDRNQPHVLKYKWEKGGNGHTGVQLHHDKCDYTINLMLSRSSDYEGGG